MKTMATPSDKKFMRISPERRNIGSNFLPVGELLTSSSGRRKIFVVQRVEPRFTQAIDAHDDDTCGKYDRQDSEIRGDDEPKPGHRLSPEGKRISGKF
jgi:hypothetical protein